jgi:hypothetical protein
MKAFVQRILAISWLSPLRRLAFRIASDPRGFFASGGAERALRRAVRVRSSRAYPVSNWDRAALMAAARATSSKTAVEFVYRLLVRRQNYVAALELVSERPFDSFSLDTRISIIKHGYYGISGVESDRLLAHAIAEHHAAIASWPIRRFRDLVDSIRFSGFDSSDKLEYLGRIGADSTFTGVKRVAWEAAIVELKRRDGVEEPTPARFDQILHKEVPNDQDLDLVRAYWPVAREGLDRAVTAAFMKRALVSTAVTVRHTPFICRELTDDDILSVLSANDVFRRLADFPQVLNFRTYTAGGDLARDIVARGVHYWFDDTDRRGRSKFMNAPVDIHNQIVGILNRADRWDIVLPRVDLAAYSDTFLDVAFARAFADILADDYPSANVRFEDILRQNPDHRLSWFGLQWASVRATGELDRIESLRREIGRGVAHSGRPTMNHTVAEELVMTSRMWRGDYRRNPLASVRPAWRAVQKQFGARFVDYSRFLEPDVTKDLLIIPINGVSDEVRDAYEYSDLIGQFRSITALCDPRLERVLSTSFPAIRFVPFARRDKPLHVEDKREDPIAGVPTVLANFVPDSLRDFVLADTTVITPGRNLSARRLADHEYDTRPGAYLSTGRAPVVRTAGTLRVGILWRSHVTAGFRGMMYLSFDDIAPVFDTPGVEFVSLQHKVTDEEATQLDARGVSRPDVDLFNDFDGIADVVSGLDLVIGISTFPVEFAAALGVPVWMLGFSPENFYMRTLGGQRRSDVMTANSTIVAPDVPRFWMPRDVSISETVDVVRRELAALVRKDASWKP